MIVSYDTIIIKGKLKARGQNPLSAECRMWSLKVKGVKTEIILSQG